MNKPSSYRDLCNWSVTDPTSFWQDQTNLNYNVVAVSYSGDDAVEKAEKRQPDLVLMDIVLKGEMDGIKTAEIIHSRFDIPVVYLTAYTDEKTLQRAKIT